jgi:hypothetical protein
VTFLAFLSSLVFFAMMVSPYAELTQGAWREFNNPPRRDLIKLIKLGKIKPHVTGPVK